MTYRRYWVGLDAGHLETAVCLIDESGRVLFEALRDTHAGPIHDILRQFGVENVQQITIEAGVGTHMVRRLRERGLPVRIVDVRKSSKFLGIRRQKTDVSDAKGLAELGLLAGPLFPDVFLKPLDCQNIRTQLNIRQSLLGQRARTDALIQSIVRLHGGEVVLRNGRGALASEVGEQLKNLRRDGFDVEGSFAPLVATAETLRTHLSTITRSLNKLASSHPICARFQTIPGVGPITALSFYSGIGDPFRFKRDRDVGAYFGLTPKLYQSGITSRRGGISRFGNKMTRTHLITAATVLLSKSAGESRLGAWGLELASRTGGAKARVAVARKLSVIMLKMWKDGTHFEPAHM